MTIFLHYVLAYEVGKIGGFKPAVFNAANETAVYAFLDGKIVFSDIYKIVTAVLESMEPDDTFTLDKLIGCRSMGSHKKQQSL